jgi:hypothetical protein
MNLLSTYSKIGLLVLSLISFGYLSFHLIYLNDTQLSYFRIKNKADPAVEVFLSLNG